MLFMEFKQMLKRERLDILIKNRDTEVDNEVNFEGEK